MSDAYFVFPSDADRAENEDLNRVCEYVEDLQDELERARTRCKLLRRKTRAQKRSLGRKVERLRNRTDALAEETGQWQSYFVHAVAGLSRSAEAGKKYREEAEDQYSNLLRTRQERDQLKAQVNALTSAISTSGAYKTNEELCDLMHETPVHCLAQHDAEVIKQFVRDYTDWQGIDWMLTAFMHKRVDELSHQANKED
jgi:SMC interacting uncharacterized protein involved in chromosome segregation